MLYCHMGRCECPPLEDMTSISKPSTLFLNDEFSLANDRFFLSRWAMYSVALLKIVALLSLCAGVTPPRSSSMSSPASALISSIIFVELLTSSSACSSLWTITRRAGTLSRRAAILSFRLVRYRFSIMLCAVFLGPRAGLETVVEGDSSLVDGAVWRR